MDARSKKAEIDKFSVETHEKLASAYNMMRSITDQQVSLENLILEIVSDNPVLEHLKIVIQDFDPSDDNSADQIHNRLNTVLDTVCSVLRLDAVSFESEILKRIVERVK